MNRSLQWTGGLALAAVVLGVLWFFPTQVPEPEVRQLLLHPEQVSRLIVSPKTRPGGKRSHHPRWIRFESPNGKPEVYVTAFTPEAAEQMLSMSERLQRGTPPTDTIGQSIDAAKGDIQLPTTVAHASYLCLLRSTTSCAVTIRIYYGSRPE